MTNRFTTVQLSSPAGNANPTAALLWDGTGDDTCLLINLSATVTVYIDVVNTIIPSDPVYNIPLLPYATLVVSSQVYAVVSPGQSAIVAVVPGGISAQDPLQIATAIAQMGSAPEIDNVNGFNIAFTQESASTSILPYNSPGFPQASGRIWSITMAATVSATVSNGASARIESSRFAQRLLELDFQPPASGQPQYGSISRYFQGGLLIEPGDSITLDLTNATGLSWFASASLTLSVP